MSIAIATLYHLSTLIEILYHACTTRSNPMINVQTEIDIIKRSLPRGPARAQALTRLAERVSAEWSRTPAPAARVPVTKADASMADPGPEWNELLTHARIALELGEVPDIMTGLAQAARKYPQLRQQYEAAQLACLPGATCPTTDEADAGAPPLHPQETDMDPAQDDRLTKGSQAEPTSATAELLERIAKRQAAEPSLSYQQASDQVLGEDRVLYQAYVAEQRLPQPRGRQVTKREPLSYEAVLKMADAQVAQRPAITRMQALVELLEAHQGMEDFGAIHQAYRKYHVGGDGLRDFEEARLAKVSAG
jgi:hypothetical protein